MSLLKIPKPIASIFLLGLALIFLALGFLNTGCSRANGDRGYEVEVVVQDTRVGEVTCYVIKRADGTEVGATCGK